MGLEPLATQLTDPEQAIESRPHTGPTPPPMRPHRHWPRHRYAHLDQRKMDFRCSSPKDLYCQLSAFRAASSETFATLPAVSLSCRRVMIASSALTVDAASPSAWPYRARSTEGPRAALAMALPARGLVARGLAGAASDSRADGGRGCCCCCCCCEGR